MEKKILALALSLVVCLGLAAPALATSADPNVEGADAILVEYDYEEVNYPLDLYQVDCQYGSFFMDNKGWLRSVEGYCKLQRNTPITITNYGQDASAYTYVLLQRYTYCEETKLIPLFDEEYEELAPVNVRGTYFGTDTPVALVKNVPMADGSVQTASAGNHLSWMWYEDGPADWLWIRKNTDSVKLYPGESITFTLPDESTDTIYRLIYVMYYPEYPEWKFYGWDWLKCEEAVGSRPVPPTVSVPTEPGKSSKPASPASSTVLVNGKNIAFDAYSINGNNYFKLRDLAYVLSGTEKQFEVGWDGDANAISLTSGAAYTAVGGEMTGKGSGTQAAKPSAAKILLDGKEISLTAYEIGGNNYFKLRDIGRTFDFGIGWDGGSRTITIDTSTGYTAE